YIESLYNLLLKTEDAQSKFVDIRKKLKSPFVELIYASICLNKQDFDEAVEVYKNLPRAFLISPGVIVEFSRALAQSGKYDEALAAISVMHKARLYTKNSLQIFRDLALKKQLIDKSIAAQKVLESKYKDDAGVQYGRAILALKTGNPDTALQILTDLTQKYPKEERFELAKMSIYLLQEKYSQVVDECKKSKIDPNLFAGILAVAYIKLDKQDLAEDVYKKAIKENKSFSIMMEYAQLLVNTGKHQEAVKMYENIRESFKKRLDEDSKINALLLNNFAWSLLQDRGSQKKTALKAAKSAYDLFPDNINIIDTYATALIQNNKFKQCINLLANNAQIRKEPQLLFHLAKSYEKTKDLNNAVRNYRLVVESDTSDNKIKLVVSKSKLRDHIEKLAQE
ncbi:MAG: tetratricopeptide repeat protein, partial [Chitinispirillia bacterium]